MTWLLSLPAKIKGLLAAAGAVLVAVALAYLKGRNAGSKAAQAKQNQAEWEALSEAQKIDEHVAGNDPSENRRALKKWARGR